MLRRKDKTAQATASETQFAVSRRDHDAGTSVISVEGELDVSTAPALKWALLDSAQDGHGQLVVDLSLASFMDSTALGVLIGVQRSLDAGGRMAIVCATPTIIERVRGLGYGRRLCDPRDARRGARHDLHARSRNRLIGDERLDAQRREPAAGAEWGRAPCDAGDRRLLRVRARARPDRRRTPRARTRQAPLRRRPARPPRLARLASRKARARRPASPPATPTTSAQQDPGNPRAAGRRRRRARCQARKARRPLAARSCHDAAERTGERAS